jgi:N-acetylglutamate synthase-like GNAT family acetyltransferase
MDFHFSCNQAMIRPATRHDAKAVRMIIPELRETSVCFVAINDENHIIGAAGATRSCRTQPPIGPGVAIHVIEPCRRRGIGRRLLQCLEKGAAAGGAQALYGAARVVQDSEAMRAWQWLGFLACETVELQRLPLGEFVPRLAPLIERMKNQARIPSTARIIPLYESNLGAVLKLHLDNLGGNRGDLFQKLRGNGAGAFHPRYSRVLLVDDKVAGCILAHRKDKDTAIVDADTVDPSRRGGWANLWLKLEATQGALLLGIKNFEFTSFDHYTDTRSFTRKMGGVTIQTTLLMMKPLVDETQKQAEE